MSGFFFELGKKLGPTVRKGQWIWQSATGDERDIIEAEAKVGRDLARAMTETGSAESNSAPQVLCAEIGQRLASQLANQHRHFEFTVLTTGEPNAFALPGGYIFVTDSLIELIGGVRDELSFVLSHEIAHVVKKHAMERVMTDAVIGAAVRALPATRLAANWIHSAGAKLLTSAYSQDHEFEADRFGNDLSTSSDFATDAGSRMLARLAERHGDESSGLPLAEYFATHPPLKDRIERLSRC